MGRLLVAVAVWLLVIACVPRSQAPRDVSGTGSITFVTDGEPTLVPRVYEKLRALTLSRGTFEAIPAITQPDGSFVIPEVPGGAFYLQDDTSYTVTSQTSLDLGFALMGRSDAARARASTRLTYDVSNLNPWKSPRDVTLLYSGGGAVYDRGAETRATTMNPPATGATQLAMNVDYTQGQRIGLFDTAKGDQLFVVQLTTRVFDTIEYVGAQRAFSPASAKLVSGQNTTLMGNFTDLTQQSRTFNWHTGSFNAAQEEVASVASQPALFLEVFAQPQGAGRGEVDFMADLTSFAITSTKTGLDGEPFTLRFGNPYPSSWALVGTATATFQTMQAARGAVATPLVGRVAYRDVLERFEDTAIETKITPVRNLKIGGRDAFTKLSGVTLNPEVTWDAPRLGTAKYLLAFINRVFAEGGVTKIETVATVRTRDRKLTIPPDVLVAGEQYSLRLRVIDTPIDADVTPYESRFPEAFADTLSEIFEP